MSNITIHFVHSRYASSVTDLFNKHSAWLCTRSNLTLCVCQFSLHSGQSFDRSASIGKCNVYARTHNIKEREAISKAGSESLVNELSMEWINYVIIALDLILMHQDYLFMNLTQNFCNYILNKS